MPKGGGITSAHAIVRRCAAHAKVFLKTALIIASKRVVAESLGSKPDSKEGYASFCTEDV